VTILDLTESGLTCFDVANIASECDVLIESKQYFTGVVLQPSIVGRYVWRRLEAIVQRALTSMKNEKYWKWK
jgi:hypothetical protein